MLTLEEIKNVTFHKARNGYQTEDVDDFIDSVIETVDNILHERDDYLKKLDIFAKKVEEYRSTEESVGSVLLSAQRLADSNIREANHKAEVILRDAKAKADAMVKEAKEKSDAMMTDAKQKSDKLLADSTANSRRAIAAGNLELERQKELLKKITADVKAFQSVLLKRYRAQITAVKNITDIQAQIRTDEEIDKEYPTPKKEIVAPKAEEKKAEETKSDEKAKPAEEAKAVEETKQVVEEKPVEIPVEEKKASVNEEIKEPVRTPAETVFASVEHKKETIEKKPVDEEIEDNIDISSSSTVKREPIEQASRFAEDKEVKFNDFKFGSDFDIHSKK
jgi:cell division initiation protein